MLHSPGACSSTRSRPPLAHVHSSPDSRFNLHVCAQGPPFQRTLQLSYSATGELAKFRLAPFGTVFSALKVMLDDFVGANVDAVAELLDTAGRFLYRLPETHVRMANMAEVTRHTTKMSAHVVLSALRAACPRMQSRHGDAARCCTSRQGVIELRML